MTYEKQYIWFETFVKKIKIVGIVKRIVQIILFL